MKSLIPIRALTAIVALFLSPVCAHANEQFDIPLTDVTISKFDKQVSFSLPDMFELGYENENANTYIAEYVMQGEQVEQWTQLVSVIISKLDRPAKLDEIVNIFAYQISTNCPDTFKAQRLIHPKSISGIDIDALFLGCGTTNANAMIPGLNESFIVYSIAHDDVHISIQWAVRDLPINQPPQLDDIWWTRSLLLLPIALNGVELRAIGE